LQLSALLQSKQVPLIKYFPSAQVEQTSGLFEQVRQLFEDKQQDFLSDIKL
jgi:hypothetical protein